MNKTFFALGVALLSSIASAQAAVGGTFKVDNLTYTITSEEPNEVSVKASNKNIAGSLDIPETVEYEEQEYTVTSIAASGFMSCKSLTGVSIPSTIVRIGKSAFNTCPLIESVTIPKSVTFIGSGAFSNCQALEEISVDANNAYYCSDEGVVYNKRKNVLHTYPDGKKATTFDIPATVDTLFTHCLLDANNLVSVTIPESVVYADTCAIYSCASLASIEIPATLTNIAPGGVGGRCFVLKEINVAEGNPNYVSVDGILYNKAQNILLVYPAGREDQDYTISETVDSLVSYAFASARNLTSITIPATIQALPGYSLFNCANLKRLIDLREQPQKITSNTFQSTPTSVVIYVPAGSQAAYEAATTWKNFKTIREIGAMMVSLNSRIENMVVGESVELTSELTKYEDVEVDSTAWTSSNPDVATVSDGGKVTAVGEGTATITVTVTDELGATCEDQCAVTVTAAAGIKVVTVEGKESIDYSQPYMVYNLTGVKIGNSIKSLPSGVYVVRQANTSAKVVIRD